MIGFHMQNDQIIGSFVAENFFDVFKPFFAEIFIDRVHNGNLFAFYYI